jgi:predicted amidophosphoribosyltransferase
MGLYRGTLRSLIRLLKFDDRLELAAPLARRAHTYLVRRGPALPPVDLIVPVPLPALRRLRRG